MAGEDGASPRLTVIVPAWNAAATIEAAVASVLDQRDVTLECLVVDDASRDGTAALVHAMAEGDPRLRLIRAPGNEGASAARNRALEVARGEWLGFLDADDRLLPGGLGAMLRAADATHALAVVGQRISSDGRRTWFPTLYDLPDIRRPGVKSVARNPGLLYYAGPAGKLFHRSVAEGLRFEGRVLGDQPWIVRAMLRAGDRIAVIEDIVYEWRRPHPERYVATLTSARERSARLGAEAAGMASLAWATVAAEIDRVVGAADRQRLKAAYFERLIRADLAGQLSAAVSRGDPGTGALLAAMAHLVTSVPPEVVAGSEAVARQVLEPPLRAWPRLPPTARAAYWDLVATVLRVDPSLVGRVSARDERLALALAVRRPRAVTLPPAILLLLAGWFVRGVRRRAAARLGPLLRRGRPAPG